MLQDGLSLSDIARELGVSKPTVCYHARRLGVTGDGRFARRYDWLEVQAFYDQGRSIRDCAREFGFCLDAWHRAAKAGLVRSRPTAAPLEKYLVSGRRVNGRLLRNRLIEARLKSNRCELCGIAEWLGRPLSLSLHHVNGDGYDNRLENLQILCPNRHSQTPNFGSRNPRRRLTLALRRLGARPLRDEPTRRLPVLRIPLTADAPAPPARPQAAACSTQSR